jgi:hypothetical protein|nr:MAG TPA: hypothetical protein [Caudoviricetes sp.]
MKIEKEYNLHELANKVKESIKLGYRLTAKTANLNLITAQQIVDVLETVASWEKDKANEMELHNKKDANGNTLRSMDYILKRMLKPVCFGCHVDGVRKCNLCIYEKECMIETEIRDCFGAYDGDIECECCDSKEECENARDAAVLNETQTNNTVPDCYGCYYDKGLYCPDCKSRESCVEETINRKNIEEDDDFI